MFDSGTDGNQVLGNTIAGNGEIGVFMVNGASDNIIGGSTAGAGNDIRDNTVTGVEIHDLVSTGNRILGNDIHGNGTRGVFMVDGTSGNIVGGVPLAERNRVYDNELSGIEINGDNTFESQIRLNSIFDNVDKGILLSFGANRGIEPPVIESFVPLTGSATPDSFVDVFSDSAEEGKHYIGTIVTDDAGHFAGELSLAPYANTNLTATATDAFGDTSEFSLPVTIIAVAFTEVPPDRVVVEGDTFTLPVATTGSPEIQFKWRFRTQATEFVELADGESVSGSVTDALTISGTRPADEGYYQCVADNGLGAVNTREIFVRVVPSDIKELEVNTLADISDGNTTSVGRLLAEPGADGLVSLREALLAANSMAGDNIVRFSAEGTIQPESPMPVNDTTGTLLLDGTDSVVLDGTLLGDSGSGLVLTSDGNQIKGLGIQGFSDHGIAIEGANENVIVDCRIGTDGESPLGNGGHGVFISGGASGNRIGGTVPGEGNHIAANLSAGVAISGTATAENRIQGNTIGENVEGLPAGGNLIAGIFITEGASDNQAGGEEIGAANRIAGNDGIGVWIVGGVTARNTVLGNHIFGNGDLGIRLFEGGNENIARPEISRCRPSRARRHPTAVSTAMWTRTTRRNLPHQPHGERRWPFRRRPGCDRL